MQHKNFNLRIVFLLVLCIFTAMETFSQKNRDNIPDKYKWDLSGLYKSESDWTKAKDAFKLKIAGVESFKGTVSTSASGLLNCLEFNSILSKEATNLYIYASMHSDLDTRDMKYSGMKMEMQQLFSDYGTKSAYIQPEILSVDWETIENFIDSEPKLKVYRMKLENMFRTRKHTLSEAEERIMALSGMISENAYSVFNTFSNAEMPSPEVTLSDGKKIIVGNSEYGLFRASENRADRIVVFDAYWNNYAKFKASYGEMLYGNVKKDIFRAKARHYSSSLEAALYPNNIPVTVYHSLIENVNKNLSAFHRYLEIRKKIMGVDTLRYLDLYAPVVNDINLKYSYDEAANLVMESLKPLGNAYVEVVKKAVENQWIDVYPTPGKRSGAYSNGAHYDGHPYILLNYNDLYEDVSTLTHELGHTMHSYLSNKSQPYPTSDYEIFVAEVASTLNEVLLFNYMVETVEDEDIKLALLMNWLDRFKGTLFRQTQFAEFELKIHEVAEQGMPLTGDTFSEIYTNIVKAYYGHDKGICFIDDYINMEWAFIPHFYYNFYVYQYSTSFTASISLAEKIMNGEPGVLENYLQFLSSGGSDYPIALLANAGIDMTSPEPFAKTIDAMNKAMDEIEKILSTR
jgi:oligoendopeptidase F